MHKSKILFFDLETAGVGALNADLGWIISISYAFDRGPVKHMQICDFPLFKKEPHNDKQLLKEFSKVINEADIVCAHFGQYFDQPFLNSRFKAANLPRVIPAKLIDTWRIARTYLKLSSNRLDNLAKFLKCKHRKLDKKDGWPLWWYEYLQGKVSRKTKALMKQYNNLDTETLRECAYKLQEFWPNQIFCNTSRGHCKNCDSARIYYRGYFRTEARQYRRFQCQDCGTWGREATGEKVK